MPRFVYVGPIDGIDLPLLRLVDVRQGDEFDCTPEQADVLARQADLYQPVDDETSAIAAAAIAAAEAQFAELVPAPPVLEDEEPPAEEAAPSGRRRRTQTDTTEPTTTVADPTAQEG